ncbi:MAG: IPT/TIG domain-containing protein [Chitinophaga sp.]|uniref:IPT/TIG domain-containing protein n=1 Tax=Chitinophaga sp. TaxID=1869181 RepID=UPI0025C35591|nr:IPT/TIG domain-containing protein [Chitinophaga sp.]MBV8253388.1 IPT/TIG domain-containing protein [Chitinophaga sp.]
MRYPLIYLRLILCAVLVAFLLPSCTTAIVNPTEKPDTISITSYAPTSAGGGDTIVVYGQNFPKGKLKFNISLNGFNLDIISSSKDSLLAIVPSMAGSGPIVVASETQTFTGPRFTYKYLVNVTTVAGSGQAGAADGTGINAKFNCPWGITADTNGDLYIADCYNRLIRKVSGDSQRVSTMSIPTFMNGKTFASPYNITLDRIGHNLYVTDFNRDLLKIYADGSMNVIYTNADAVTTGIAVGPDGLLYLGDNIKGTIQKLDTSGNVISLFASGLVTPRNIIFDKDRNLYVSGHPENIYKFTSAGEQSLIQIGPFNGWEIARDARGNIYAADHFNNTVRIIEASTGDNFIIADSGAAADIDGHGVQASFNGPQGLTIDDKGQLYLTTYNYNSKGGNKIRKITIK